MTAIFFIWSIKFQRELSTTLLLETWKPLVASRAFIKYLVSPIKEVEKIF